MNLLKRLAALVLVGIALGGVAAFAAVVPLPVLIVPVVLFCASMIGWAFVLDARDRHLATYHGNGSGE